MPISPCKGFAGLFVHRQGGSDVQQQQAFHGLRVVCRKTMRHACAAVMRGNEEPRMSKQMHDGHRVARHAAFAVGQVFGVGVGPRRIAVAPQIQGDDGESLCQRIRHTVPHHMRLRMPVQEQEGRSTATDAAVDADITQCKGLGLEVLEHRIIVARRPVSEPPVPRLPP